MSFLDWIRSLFFSTGIDNNIMSNTDSILCSVGGIPIFQNSNGEVYFTSKAAIDADGGLHAYNSSNTGLDDISDAKNGSQWVGIATDRKGIPYKDIQSYYISTTSYQWSQYQIDDHRRYVDSETIPYIVVPPQVRVLAKGVVMGCKVIITNTLNGKSINAVVADTGPKNKIGEISICAAKLLGINSSPKNGGEDFNVIKYRLFPDVPAIINGVTYNLLKA